MAPAKRPSKLLGLVRELDADEISSDSLVSFAAETTSTAASTMPPLRGRGRPPANKVTKPAGRMNDTATSAARRSARRVPDETAAQDEVQKSQRGRRAVQDKQNPSRGRGRPKGSKTESAADINTADKDVGTSSIAQQGGLVDATDEIMMDAIADELDVVASPRKTTLSSSPSKRITGPIVTDSQLRRRVGDLTRSCEAWETKYRELRDLGVKEAEANFDRLKRQAEERGSVADSLISQLQLDLNLQRNLAKEGQLAQEQLSESKSKISELTATLAEARKDIKSLTAKLAAARATDAALPGAKVPGSAVKGGGVAARAAAASSDALQLAQLKEDMYGDLTGLIVRGVKRDKSFNAFDCIQTGRNGSLHFKLTIEMEDASEGYDETQFTFEPQLNEDRDQDLIGFLPDYMTDEITFPRAHATRFFQRLTRALEEQQE